MTDERAVPTSDAKPTGGGDIFNDPVFLRNMKIAVVVMAVILILGFIAIIARIFYLSSRTPAQPPKATVTMQPSSEPRALDLVKLAERGRLDLPAGATVRSMAFSGARLAVQYDAPSGGGIAILDLETGRAISRIAIGAETPR